MDSMCDLELDTDVIHENGSTYESLLNQNQVDLFSNERFKQKEKEELQEKENEKDIVQGMFLEKTGTETDDFIYNEMLFMHPMVIEKKQSYQTGAEESGAIVWIGSAVLLILFLIVMTRYLKLRRQGEEQDEA